MIYAALEVVELISKFVYKSMNNKIWIIYNDFETYIGNMTREKYKGSKNKRYNSKEKKYIISASRGPCISLAV